MSKTVDIFDDKECNICSITIKDIIESDSSKYIEKCSKCVFKSCNKCMEKWYKENNHCPQCREPYTFDIEIKQIPEKVEYNFQVLLINGIYTIHQNTSDILRARASIITQI